MIINADRLTALVSKLSNDREALDFIFDCLMTFEQYHYSVITMELHRKLYSTAAICREDYQYMISTDDKARTLSHNNVLGMVNALNRMAVKEGISAVYDGVVSEDRPYRREVANAVFDYIDEIIKKRI